MQNVPLENLVVIDIETVSCFKSFDELSFEWQDLWQEKQSRALPDGVSISDFYTQRAGVLAEFAKIVCISIGYFNPDADRQFRVKSFFGSDEKILLHEFLATLEKIGQFNQKWCFAGHNIKEFDIPFICRRLMINSIRLPFYLDFQNMKPWETNLIDTFQYWRFGDYKNYTSLKLLAAALNVPSSKDDIDGSMVGEVYWSGDEAMRNENLQRIATYCQKDVVTTTNIILRFKNMPLLNPDDIVFVSVPLARAATSL